MPHGADTRKGRLLESQKQFDQLAAQLEFLHWVVGVAKFNFNDLVPKLRIDLAVVAANVASLFRQVIAPTYKKIVSSANPIQKMLLCKEEKEQLIKSKIRVLTQLFVLANSLKSSNLDTLVQLQQELEEEDEMEGFAHEQERLDLRRELFCLALQILLVPASHQLQLLVQDVALERQLRKQCEAFIKRAVSEEKPAAARPKGRKGAGAAAAGGGRSELDQVVGE